MWAVIYTLITTHITMWVISVYVHRGACHKQYEFHPILRNLIQLWIWLFESLIVKDFIVTHRIHHATADTDRDPYYVMKPGEYCKLFWLHFWQHLASKFRENAQVRYATVAGYKETWLERNVYLPYYRTGLFVNLLIDVLLFGWAGVLVWIIQICWAPFWYSVIGNGVGHCWGYRNYNTRDNTHNIFPIGFMLAGDELHNTHHAKPGQAKLSEHWWEVDMGWAYACILESVGLMRVKR
jgi:stearoyl-CoA desaturase (delta-9 desaturase)